MSGENERLLPEPENYAKCFYDLFRNIAEAQRCDTDESGDTITSTELCLPDAVGGDYAAN